MSDFAFSAADTALMVIDVQERFQTVIPDIAQDQPVGRNCRILVESARLLAVPILVSEQYPKGLGPTVPHLAGCLGDVPRLAKTHFSCCDDEPLAAEIIRLQRRVWIVCGIEAHICVLATVADLLQGGRAVIVAGDAVASRRPEHRALALQAARDLGALVLPTETIAFRWLRRAQGDAFKAISALVR